MKKRERRQNKLILKMTEAGLNPKKEIITIVMTDIFLVFAAVYAFFMTKMLIASLSILLLIAAGDYYLLCKPWRLSKIKSERLESEFVHIFSFFKIFVVNGRPVYNALEDCIAYSSIEMGELLERLILSIDCDKSVKPYLAFSENFGNLEIRQAMISIYKMSNEGGSSQYAQQFEAIFASLSDEKRKAEVDKYASTLDNMQFLPLADSALTIGLIIVAIVVIMGRLTYGV